MPIIEDCLEKEDIIKKLTRIVRRNENFLNFPCIDLSAKFVRSNTLLVSAAYHGRALVDLLRSWLTAGLGRGTHCRITKLLGGQRLWYVHGSFLCFISAGRDLSRRGSLVALGRTLQDYPRRVALMTRVFQS